MASLGFQCLKTEGFARRGRLVLAHGTVETPAFMPVGTHGAVKTLSPLELSSVGTQILLGNAYHLYLRPGLDVLRKMGGLHRFMGWKGPILTDSGGFQVFSLANPKDITDEGVVFRSHLNGDLISLTPELSAEIQQAIGSDIAMVFDECVALPNSNEAISRAVDRSLDWAVRFLNYYQHGGPRQEGHQERQERQMVFGIIQGGTSQELREKSLKGTTALAVDGIAIGGLSVGEPHSVMIETLEGLAPHLTPAMPHYLMGVGTPLDLLEAVRCGVDMFDCVLPTRNARNGGFFTDDGLLNIRNQIHRMDDKPVDASCPGECCRTYSRAYLRHLFQIKEILACRLATIHNLLYYHRFMSGMRHSIETGDFAGFYRTWKGRLTESYGQSRISEGLEPTVINAEV